MINNNKSNELEALFLKGICLFEKQDYDASFEIFIFLFQNQYKQQTIFDILTQAYYEPNEEEIKIRYQNNIALLKEYPFLFQKNFPLFEQLSYRFYPTGAYEGKYQIFNIKENTFENTWDMKYDTIPYFFSDLSRPLCIENEFGQYQLQYLIDNVRRSEDYGGDNHVYLYYEDFDMFCNYMQVLDFTSLLSHNKLVFLFGKEEKKKYYPSDFKKYFQIDYKYSKPKPVQIDEVKRMIYECQVLPNAGNAFLQQILDWHPNLLTMGHSMSEFGFFYEAKLKDKSIDAFIKTLLEDITHEKIDSQWQTMFLLFGFPQDNEHWASDWQKFIIALKKVCPVHKVLDKKQWFVAFFLAHAYMYQRNLEKERIVPAVCFGMHYIYEHPRTCVKAIQDIFKEFPYRQKISSIRDPLAAIAGNINMLKNTGALSSMPYFPNIYEWLLDGENVYAKYYNKKETVFSELFVIRFEDLKLNPKATLTALAQALNIPYSYILEETSNKGKRAEKYRGTGGFDPSPIYKTRKEFLNDFDRFRLEAVIFRHYSPFGYKSKYYDGTIYSESDMQKMLEIPFRFESYITNCSRNIFEDNRKIFVKRAMELYHWAITDSGYEDKIPHTLIEPIKELVKVPLYE